MNNLSFVVCLFVIYFGNSQKDVVETNMGKIRQQLPVINKEATYPLKVIKLEDIADVTYIPLETSKEILLDRDCHVDYVSDKQILVTNPMRGDVFIFDINGRIMSHFNQRGGNGYARISCVVYDKTNNEVFILDHISRKILVYKENGMLKRTIHLPSDASIAEIFNFDDNSLLAFHEHEYGPINQTKPYMFLSKKDGNIISRLNITMNKANPKILFSDDGPNKSRSYTIKSSVPDNCKFGQDFILAKRSSDTIYLLKQDKTLAPLFVQYPSVFSEHPIIATVGMKTDHFITFSLNSYDLKEVKKMTDSGQKYIPAIKPRTLMYEIQTGQFFEYRGSIGSWKVDLPKNMGVNLIYVQSLVEDMKKGRLQGKLLKIVGDLKVGDNPVVKLVKFK